MLCQPIEAEEECTKVTVAKTSFLMLMLCCTDNFFSIRKVITAVWGFVVNAGIGLGDDVPLYSEVVTHEGVHSLVNLKIFL